METIRRAAIGGRLAEVNRLLEEDPGLLNARVSDDGLTPLMGAAWEGHNAMVARLLQLGADVNARDESGRTAAHNACWKASTLALLLDAGASIDARMETGETPLMAAADEAAPRCLRLLLARGGAALELDAQRNDGRTALHCAAAWYASPEAVQMLLAAGADPTIRNYQDETPLDKAEEEWEEEWGEEAASCVVLLEAALAEPERPRLLLRARDLLDTAAAVPKAAKAALDDGLSYAAQHRAALAAAPAYLKRRVAWAQELPRVEVVEGEEAANEKLLGCLKYALGLEGGGGWHEDEGPPPQGMVKDVFVELCELLAPKWARKDM